MLMRHSYLWAGLAAACLIANSVFADATIDASQATRITLPAAGDAPTAFKTSDGKAGWVRRLSRDAIPTPAYKNGRIFTGTGMGSSSFLAIDAESGATVWQKATGENGPTSPVISDKYVSYNTECCATETRDIDSGELLWSEMTGGTLLTQPVVSGTMLVVPHPTMARKAKMSDDSFRMLCVDMKTGHHAWDTDMTADVLGAPVTGADGRIFFTCTDGRLFCISSGNGGGGWHVMANATSAPVVVGDRIAVTTEEKRTFGGAAVSIRRYSIEDGSLLDKQPIAPTNVSKAVLAANQRAEWDYQGPKIAASGKHLFNAPGQIVNSVDLESGKPLWRSIISGGGITNSSNALTPPALGKNNVYLGTNKGHVLILKQSDGSLASAYNIGEPLASQPILADGNIYFGTASGLLVCLKLQDGDAKDWTAWGGNAQHNKID